MPRAPGVDTKTAPAGPESIRRRYLATLLGQAVQLAASVITAGVVPRVLGPAVFGNYNFLLTTAATIRGFTEPSTQQAFFTFSSQERHSGALTKLYGGWVLLQFGLLVGLVILSAAVGISEWIWPGQRTDQILLLTVLDWVAFVCVSLKQLGDSKGLSVKPQAIGVGTSLLGLIGLLGLVALRRLDFYTYALLNLIVASLGCLGLAYWLLVVQRDICWAGDVRGRIRQYTRRWWGFAAPIILVEYYTPLVGFLGVYLVQRWYGSVEQGYFALGSRWSAVVMLFTSSAMMIIWREIAHATSLGDDERAARIFLRSSGLLFFVTLVLCVWLAAGSETLIRVLAGDKYLPGVPVLAIMAFYPAQQTLGQLNTAAFKATGRTVAYRNITILLSLPDLVLTYLLLAPASAPLPGLGLGAIGVALRMVVYGLASVQVHEWLNLQYFRLSWRDAVKQKMLATALVGACGLVAFAGLDSRLIARWHNTPLLAFALVSTVYFSGVVGLVFSWPGLLGLRRADLTAAVAALRARGADLFG